MNALRPSSFRVKDRFIPWKFRLALFASLPAAWLVQWLARFFPEAVERGYSRTVYPVVRDVVGTFTGWFGWSLAEMTVILAVLAMVGRVTYTIRQAVRKRRSWRNVAAHYLSGTLALAGLAYGIGVAGWGLNYQRQPFARSAGLDVSPADAAELARLCEGLSFIAAELRDQVDEDEAGVMRPQDAPREALQRAPLGFALAGADYEILSDASATRPKAVLLPVLPWLHIGGVFAMFTSESNVNMHQPASGILSAGCHEIAHQLGWAREEEASFVGYVACRMHPDVDYRYAATQSALRRALGALGRVDREAAAEIYARLHDGIRRDWEASRAFWARYRTPIADVAERMNDAYLKSQGQEAGVKSYGLMVDLLVGDMRRAAPVSN